VSIDEISKELDKPRKTWLSTEQSISTPCAQTSPTIVHSTQLSSSNIATHFVSIASTICTLTYTTEFENYSVHSKIAHLKSSDQHHSSTIPIQSLVQCTQALIHHKLHNIGITWTHSSSGEYCSRAFESASRWTILHSPGPLQTFEAKQSPLQGGTPVGGYNPAGGWPTLPP
jgi:hypothetical protein